MGSLEPRGSALVACLLAGFFGAASGSLGKLAASDRLCVVEFDSLKHFDVQSFGCVAVRLALLVANFSFGGLMWFYYIRCMNASSSVAGTVAVNAASTLITAILGFLVFSEVPNLAWCGGALCITAGLAMMSPGMQSQKVGGDHRKDV